MKSPIIYIALLFGWWSASCDSYLETDNFGKVLPETTEDYASLINTWMFNVGDKYSGNPPYYTFYDVLRMEAFTDNLNASLSTGTSSSYIPMYVGAYMGSAIYRFEALYEPIRDANIVLDNMEDDGSELWDKTVAAARTLRGISYFTLMREFCEPYEASSAGETMGVPIVDHFDMNAAPGRGDLQTTVNFIVNDLRKAVEMNMNDEAYPMTSDVAEAFLARTYFWGQEWQNAIETAQSVLEKYPLAESDEYEAMIQSVPPLETLPQEVIFATWTQNSPTTMFNNIYSRYSRYRPLALDLAALFEEKERDIRYELFFDKEFLNTKRMNGFVRSSEMCLIIAESYAHLGDETNALRYLNMLREKRISDYQPLTADNLPSATTCGLVTTDCTGAALTPLMAAILNERRKELYMECDRWFELKRNGRPEFWVGYNGVKYTTEQYMYTWPLRNHDLIANPDLQQNPGYDQL